MLPHITNETTFAMSNFRCQPEPPGRRWIPTPCIFLFQLLPVLEGVDTVIGLGLPRAFPRRFSRSESVPAAGLVLINRVQPSPMADPASWPPILARADVCWSLVSWQSHKHSSLKNS